MVVPEASFSEASPALQLRLLPQITTYGFLVRFFTPAEALRIAGIRPLLSAPPLLVWELAGNACSPLLLFEALLLIMPLAYKHAFLVQDLRAAWLRSLGLSLPSSAPSGPFPAPIDTTIMVFSSNRYYTCRIHATAPLEDLLSAVSLCLGLAVPHCTLRASNGSARVLQFPATAGSLYGKTLYVHIIADAD